MFWLSVVIVVIAVFFCVFLAVFYAKSAHFLANHPQPSIWLTVVSLVIG